MSAPLITIAIPSYNHGKYIQYCLDSARDEDYTNKEILVIDDGSSDNSVETIKLWKQKNPAVNITFISRENRGLNATLNQLIENAKGDIMCFVASDDILLKGGISNRLKVFSDNPKKMAVIGDAKVINSVNEIIMESAISDLYNGNKEKYRNDDLLLVSVISEWSVPGPVLLVRKDIYRIIGLYPEGEFAEDINFYMKVIGMRLLSFIDIPVALYRVHSNNTGGNPKYSKQISMTFIKAYINNIKYFPFKLQLVVLKKLIGRIYLYLKACIFQH